MKNQPNGDDIIEARLQRYYAERPTAPLPPNLWQRLQQQISAASNEETQGRDSMLFDDVEPMSMPPTIPATKQRRIPQLAAIIIALTLVLVATLVFGPLRSLLSVSKEAISSPTRTILLSQQITHVQIIQVPLPAPASIKVGTYTLYPIAPLAEDVPGYRTPPTYLNPDTTGSMVQTSDGGFWFAARGKPGATPNSYELEGVAHYVPTGKLMFYVLASPARNLAKGPDGNVWFVDEGGINRLSADGELTTFATPGPLRNVNFEFAKGGTIWSYMQFGSHEMVVHITISGKLTEYPDIHTSDINMLDLWFIGLAVDNTLWFSDANEIGRMTVTGRVLSRFVLPIASQTTNPPIGITEIYHAPDDTCWVAYSNGDIWHVMPDGKASKFHYNDPFIAPDSQGRASLGFVSMVATPDGNLWFGVVPTGETVRLSPTGVFTSFRVPAQTHAELVGYPASMLVGADHNLWFVEGGGAFIVTFDPRQQ